MKFSELVELAGELQCFSTRFIAAGRNLDIVRLQLSRWINEGKVIKIHKGLYTLAPPYRKVEVSSYYLANKLKGASYVSLHSALSYFDIIPEYVPIIISVCTGRPRNITTPFGVFEFRHISKKYFWGYQTNELSSGEEFLIARPEKALLDLVYFVPEAQKPEYILELRLQNLEQVDGKMLKEYAERFSKPKITAAAKRIREMV
jgi:predicted transcriptional regulator of viral defense system